MHLVGDRRFGQAGRRLLQADDALAFARAIDHDAEFQPGTLLEGLASHLELGARGDQDARFAVGDDVGEFACRQVGIHAGEIESGALAGAAGFEVTAVVLHEDGIVVQPLETAIAQQMRQPITARLERGIGHCLARVRHDESGLQWAEMHMLAGIHRVSNDSSRPTI